MGEWENRRYEIAKFREEIGDGRSRSFAWRSEMGDREVSRGDRRWEIAKFREEIGDGRVGESENRRRESKKSEMGDREVSRGDGRIDSYREANY